MQRKIISSFKDGLAQLQKISSFEGLRETIKDMVSVCPPTEAHLCKPRIAALMRQKHFGEIRKVKGHPAALQDIDAKYRNLAMVLHKLPIGGMRLPGGSRSGQRGQLGSYPQEPSNKKLPAKPGSFGAFGLATTLAKNWFSSRKKQIAGIGMAAAGLGGLAWVYGKFYGNKDTTRKNPVETASKKGSDGRQKQLESFERAMMSMQRFKAMTQMSKDPDASIGDYKDLLTLDPRKTRSSKKTKKKEQGVNWQREGDATQKDLEKAYRAISYSKKTTDSLDIPLLTTSDFSSVDAPKKKARKKRRKRNSSPAPAEVSEPKEPRVVKARKPRAKPRVKPVAEKPTETSSVSSSPRLVPVVKRTKRVRKVR